MGNRSITDCDSASESIDEFAKIGEVKDVQNIVNEKLLKSEFCDRFKANPRLLKGLLLALSDTEELKQTYLMKDWTSSKNIHKAIDEEIMKSLNEEEREQMEGIEKSDILDGEYERFITLNNIDSVRIKIICTDRNHTSLSGNPRQVISPYFGHPKVTKKLDNFQLLLIFGPWVIEWNENSLCIPRRGIKMGGLLSEDLEVWQTLSDIDVAINKLAEVVVQWNVQHSYEKKNSYEFMVDVLNHLGIRISNDFVSTPCYNKLFENFASKGEKNRRKIEFWVSNEFKNRFKLQSTCIEFKTHEELDKFIDNLLFVCPEFQMEYKHEYNFLKVIDRSFWLKHFAFPEAKEFKPNQRVFEDDDEDESDDEMEIICPFKDPIYCPTIRFLE